jgi:tetratricopeptide (TPR) repeat protein
MPRASGPAPSERAESAPTIDRESPGVELRLAIGKDGLGIELGRTARLGCIDVTEIAVALPGVRFPLDVSGGVARFRHRRGELKRLGIEIDARALERWAAPKLRGLVGTQTPEVWIAVRRDAATVGIAARDDGTSARSAAWSTPDEEPAVLAFEVTLETREDDVSLTVANARGTRLPATPTALAISALRALVGEGAVREGARFTLPKAATRIARALLPEAGARAPSAPGIRWTMTTAATDAWVLQAAQQGVQADVTQEATRAREAAALTVEGDDARLAGDLERARALDLAALERAPRHPAIAQRIAEIDALAGGRAEAAVATLSEADPDPGAPRGPLAGELLAEAGDVAGAVGALARVGDTESVPALAARAYARAARLSEDHHDALAWLDLAVARAPSMPSVRWARVGRRLAAGRLEDALADVEHLEAIASGARAKHAVWRRAGEAWRSAGVVGEAATLFERALRYAPEDPEALAGLGAALIDEASGSWRTSVTTRAAAVPARSARAERRATRGAALLTRAIDLAEARGDDASAMTLDLARALAEALGDRPAAIARVRAVPNLARGALVARGLEARWRAALGDTPGASVAWGRVRDLATARAEEGDARDAQSAADMLREAADFERTHGDLPAAQRHLAAALRLRPRDAALEQAYRDVCAQLAPLPATPTATPSPTATLPPLSEDDESLAAARVDELVRHLQADPTRDDVVDELAALLVRLGRSLELLALLSARLEDAPPDRRAELLPQQRAVLARLEDEAKADGRDSEASLFRDARLALD